MCITHSQCYALAVCKLKKDRMNKKWQINCFLENVEFFFLERIENNFSPQHFLKNLWIQQFQKNDKSKMKEKQKNTKNSCFSHHMFMLAAQWSICDLNFKQIFLFWNRQKTNLWIHTIERQWVELSTWI